MKYYGENFQKQFALVSENFRKMTFVYRLWFYMKYTGKMRSTTDCI